MRHADDVSEPASHLTLKTGVSVFDRVGLPVGQVKRVLHHCGGAFDGIVVTTERGLRFVDAHEVRNVVRGTVVLAVIREEVYEGDSQRPNAPRAPGGKLRRLLGLTERMPVARWGQTDPSEADREAVVESLKRAYTADLIGADELAQSVERAQEASTLDELEKLLRQTDS